MALALDEPNDQDQTEEQAGYTFCVNKTLLDQIQGVKIDLTYMGFAVDPAVPFASDGASSCGSCGGGCGS
ncbi:hypothetical protein DW219_08990 [Desulfovibrio sp. AM18-2]|uniref:Uncharacterized protein n=1 Tax=Desulfovibrio legallii TaxID=571438 RepID=A0A6H3FDK4_9BACT|nr:hypothetical protein DW219_08990 [Desulfovibrio sp. AM18-2]TBH81055.1 hypothetical protein EB812_02885 [Desulfovibrio legallii]CAI3230246.1 HesB-like domain [Desulfovibrio diazotrophicus]